MENNVLDGFIGPSGRAESPDEAAPARPGAVGQAIDRSLARRRVTARDEVERLVAATFRIIERTGHLEPRVSEIVDEAGLSNQAFYRHFESKHALLVAVLDEGIRELADYLRTRMAGAADAPSAVREWIRGMAAQAGHPGGARASRPFALARGRLAESFPAEVAASERQLTAPLRTALERAVADGSMPAISPELEAEALYHLMMGWVEARLVAERMPEPSEIARLEAFALAGLTRSIGGGSA